MLLVLSGSHACLVFGQVLDNQPQDVHGTVVNAATHEPIGRALVYSPDNRYATQTNSEGHFEFALPRAAPGSSGSDSSTGGTGGLNWLMARKPGFLEDPTETRQVEVSPGTEVTISLTPEGIIKGRVTFSATEPANGVRMELFRRQVMDGMPRWMPNNSARTNSNGEFRFAELPRGIYKVVTNEWMDNDPENTGPSGQLYGYPPVYYPNATDFAAATAIQLAAGQTVQADVSLVRHPYYPVKIPVANVEQNGGPNVTVTLQGQRSPGYSLGFNRQSNAIEGQLPNGKYLVEAAFRRNSSATGSVNITVAGAPAESAGMVLAPNSSIPVNVKEEFSATEWKASGTWSSGGKTFPMPKIRLDLSFRAEGADDFAQRWGGSLREPTGPNDDSLVLENLAPGRYWLRIHAQRGYIASATMGGVDLLREPLVVVPGASTPIDITMRDDNAEVEGTLVGTASTSAAPGVPVDSGRWAPHGYVYCIPLPDSPGQFLEVSASSDGRFNQMVAPGNYRVLAFKNLHRDLPYRDPEGMKVYEGKGQIVHFAPGQKVSLQLETIPSVE
jgi:hypothetical protein